MEMISYKFFDHEKELEKERRNKNNPFYQFDMADIVAIMVYESTTYCGVDNGLSINKLLAGSLVKEFPDELRHYRRNNGKMNVDVIECRRSGMAMILFDCRIFVAFQKHSIDVIRGDKRWFINVFDRSNTDLFFETVYHFPGFEQSAGFYEIHGFCTSFRKYNMLRELIITILESRPRKVHTNPTKLYLTPALVCRYNNALINGFKTYATMYWLYVKKPEIDALNAKRSELAGLLKYIAQEKADAEERELLRIRMLRDTRLKTFAEEISKYVYTDITEIKTAEELDHIKDTILEIFFNNFNSRKPQEATESLLMCVKWNYWLLNKGVYTSNRTYITFNAFHDKRSTPTLKIVEYFMWQYMFKNIKTNFEEMYWLLVRDDYLNMTVLDGRVKKYLTEEALSAPIHEIKLRLDVAIANEGGANRNKLEYRYRDKESVYPPQCSFMFPEDYEEAWNMKNQIYEAYNYDYDDPDIKFRYMTMKELMKYPYEKNTYVR